MAGEWYNLNAVRGYPFDERATLASDAGAQIPPDTLVDCAVRFPSSLGRVAFVSALRTAATGTSLVISCGPDIDTGSLQLLGSVVVAGRPQPGRPYRLRALQAGCDGWVVFGAAATDYQGRFTTPRQSALLPRTARAYEPLPIPWISRQLDEIKLTDTVRFIAGNDIEIVSGTHEVDYVTYPAIYVRLRGSDLQQTLRRYVGTCGGRPESQTCEGASIEAINDVTPLDGNIQFDFEGLSVQPLAFGLLLNTALSLPGLCAKTTVTEQPINLCDSELIFSEISDIPPDEEVPESETDSEIGTDSETSEVFDSPFPSCTRFFSTHGLALSTLVQSRGTWALTTLVPDTFPCSANGADPQTWRSARVAAVAAASGPYGSTFSSAVLLHDDPAYPPGLNLKIQTAVRLPPEPNEPPADGVLAGFVMDYRDGAYGDSGLFVGVHNYNKLYIARSVQGRWVPLAVWNVAPIPPQSWVTLSVWATPGRAAASVANLQVRAMVADWRRPAALDTFADFGSVVFSGRNGLFANTPNTDFAYYSIDNVP